MIPALAAVLHRWPRFTPAAALAHRMTLNRGAESVSGAGLATLRRDAEHPPGATVRVVTIDDYCSRHDLAPRLLKIDVEGFELPVLEGARRVLERIRPWGVCEIRDARATELLVSLGDETHPLDAENVHFSPWRRAIRLLPRYSECGS